MKPEIMYLAWSVLLAIVHMLITVVALVQHSGMAVALGNRANLPELPGWGGRAGRANDNMAQNLVLFAALLCFATHVEARSAPGKLGNPDCRPSDGDRGRKFNPGTG